MLKKSIWAFACTGLVLAAASAFAAPHSAATIETTFNQISPLVKVAEAGEKVNINTATAEQLAAALRGVGLARAEAIVKLREELGRFTDVEQLLQVRGLGPKVLNDNRDKITL